jgi:hypothetical protein
MKVIVGDVDLYQVLVDAERLRVPTREYSVMKVLDKAVIAVSVPKENKKVRHIATAEQPKNPSSLDAFSCLGVEILFDCNYPTGAPRNTLILSARDAEVSGDVKWTWIDAHGLAVEFTPQQRSAIEKVYQVRLEYCPFTR